MEHVVRNARYLRDKIPDLRFILKYRARPSSPRSALELPLRMRTRVGFICPIGQEPMSMQGAYYNFNLLVVHCFYWKSYHFSKIE